MSTVINTGNMPTWQRVLIFAALLTAVGSAGYMIMSKQSDESVKPNAGRSAAVKPSGKPRKEKRVKKHAKAAPEVQMTKNKTSDVVDNEEEKILEESKEPSTAADFKDLGNDYFRKQDYAHALENYSKAIAIASSDPSVPRKDIAVYYANRAATYIGLQQLDKVVEDCTEALVCDPTYVKCFVRRGAAKFELGDYMDAAIDYLTICALEGADSKLTRVYMTKMEEAAMKLADAETEKVLKDRGTIESGLPGTPYCLQQFMQYREKYMSDEDITGASPSTEPEVQHFVAAVKALRAEDYETSLVEISKSLSCKDGHPMFPSTDMAARAHNLRGTFALIVHDFDLAMSEFEKSVKLNPIYVNSLLKISSLHALKQDKSSSQKYLDQALSCPGAEADPDIAFAKATMMADDSLWDASRHEFMRASELDKTRVLPKMMLIGLHTVLSEFEKADEMINDLVEQFPDQSDVHCAHGEMLARKMRFDESIAAYEKALGLLQPGTKRPAILIGMGSTYLMKRDVEEAERCFLKAIEIDPKFDQSYEMLYRNLMAQGDMTRAVETLDRLITVLATFADARKLKETIGARQFLQCFRLLMLQRPDLQESAKALMNAGDPSAA